MEGFTSYKIGNDAKFKAGIARAQAVTEDLRIPLTLISKDFYKSEQAIFMLKSAGQYPDFKNKENGFSDYQIQKLKKWDFDYPLLKASGKLEASLTNPDAPGAVNQIINKRTLIIGTQQDYGIFHQSDRPRKKIPLRKFLFIGPESSFANSDQQGRVGRWLNIMNDFVVKKLKQRAA